MNVCWIYSISFFSVLVFFKLDMLFYFENKKVFKRGRMKTF